MDFVKRNGKRILVEGLGWVLVVLGVAALVLPGPGLLMLFAGMALLATQYEWAERRLKPIRRAALKTAADGVKTWPRIIISIFFCAILVNVGILWGIHPDAPAWWPLANGRFWLLGGWGAGGTLIASGLIAFAMIVYSAITFRSTNKHKH